jgi:Lon protease-like protein
VLVKPIAIALALAVLAGLSPQPAKADLSAGALAKAEASALRGSLAEASFGDARAPQAVTLQLPSKPTADGTTLPTEIPLFPLPEVVLFPGMARPLVIYEPRYREMVADALKGDRIIGMVLLRPGYEKDYEGRPPVYTIGSAGVIEDYEQVPDGRYLILLRGLTTFRILSEDQRKPYRLARVEAVPELLKDEERVPLGTLRDRVEQLLFTVLPFGAEPPDPGLDDAEFINVTAQNLSMPEADRQDLLERNSLLSRARALLDRIERK